jgi:hypothetical protein
MAIVFSHGLGRQRSIGFVRFASEATAAVRLDEAVE